MTRQTCLNSDTLDLRCEPGVAVQSKSGNLFCQGWFHVAFLQPPPKLAPCCNEQTGACHIATCTQMGGGPVKPLHWSILCWCRLATVPHGFANFRKHPRPGILPEKWHTQSGGMWPPNTDANMREQPQCQRSSIRGAYLLMAPDLAFNLPHLDGFLMNPRTEAARQQQTNAQRKLPREQIKHLNLHASPRLSLTSLISTFPLTWSKS